LGIQAQVPPLLVIGPQKCSGVDRRTFLSWNQDSGDGGVHFYLPEGRTNPENDVNVKKKHEGR
jgi:hypothetical protein